MYIYIFAVTGIVITPIILHGDLTYAENVAPERTVQLSDQTAWMFLLILSYTICIWHVTNVPFSRIRVKQNKTKQL